MRKSFTILAMLLIVTILDACHADPPPASDPACDPALEEAFAAWGRAGFSGSVAIAAGGRFDCLGGWGYADEAAGTPNTTATVFGIGSVTKAVTAAAVLALADEGRLSLADRAGDHVPELSGPVAGVTLRQLLLHTSGLVGTAGEDHEPLSEEQAIAAIDRLELAFEPGSDYVYSNAGYTLLALVVEHASGTSYRDYLMSRILRLPDGRAAGGFWNGEPAAAGPRAVGYLDGGGTGEPGDFPGPHWALEGNGSVAMSTADLAAWTHALFAGDLLSPGAVETIGSPGFDHGGGRSETPGWVAFDASVYGEPFLATAGGGGDVGHNVVVAWVPARERAIVIASNRPELTAEDLLAAVGPSLLAGDPLPTPPAAPAGIDPGTIVGTYQIATGGSYEVTRSADQLVVSATGADAVAALFPPGDGVSGEDIRRHESLVLALLAGQTQEGRTEREALESAFGTITDVALAGTVPLGGELRTYVTIAAGGQPRSGWYAVNEHGGIEAAEVPAGPPTVALVPAGGTRFRPDDPTGSGPAVSLEFQDGRLTITGPAGATVARLSASPRGARPALRASAPSPGSLASSLTD